MVPGGLEPRTLRLLAVRSNQLSYETSWLIQKIASMRRMAASREADYELADSGLAWRRDGDIDTEI